MNCVAFVRSHVQRQALRVALHGWMASTLCSYSGASTSRLAPIICDKSEGNVLTQTEMCTVDSFHPKLVLFVCDCNLSDGPFVL